MSYNPFSKYVRLPKSCGQYTFNLEHVLQTPSLAQQQVLTQAPWAWASDQSCGNGDEQRGRSTHLWRR
jgi:hypothetical protein